MNKNLSATCVAIGTLIASLAASAQTEPQNVIITGTAQKGLGLETPSQTGSRLGLTPLETPASVSSLSASDMAERSITRAQDAAISLPGVSQAPEPGTGGISLSARGFRGADSVAQMVDGTRITAAAGTISYPFSTWPLESVELLSGPASVLYGDGAIGAAVNYITKAPLFDRSVREAFLSGGSFGTWMGGIGARGPINELAAYSVYLGAAKSDGQRRDSAYKRQNYDLALALRPSQDLKVTLSLDGGHNDDSRYFGTPLLNGKLDRRLIDTSFNVGNALVNFNDNMWRAKAEYRLSDDVELHNETYFLTSKRHWRNAEDYYFDSPTEVVRDAFLEILHDEKQLGNRFDATVNGHVAGLRNRLVGGAEWYRTTFSQSTNSPYEDGYSVVDPYDVEPGVFDSLSPTTRARDATLKTTALFLEDKLDLTPEWTLVAGLRHDFMAFNNHNLRTDVSLGKRYSPTTGRLGTVWAPSKSLSLYAQFSTGTDPLSGALSLPSGGTSFTLTRGRQVEIGAKGLLPEVRGQWTVAAYRIVKDKLLSQDPLNPDITQQIGKQSSTGVEFALDVEPLRDWNLTANLALLRARYENFNEQQGDGSLISRSGNVPYGVPEQTANVWSTYRVTPQWLAGVGAKHVGKVYSDTDNAAYLPGYTVVNALVTYAYTPKTTLTFSVNNLTDKVYAVSGYGGYLWLLGDKRNFQLTARTSF